jgi:uncharacterized membrane protein YuzA (DUF378 family)
MNSLKDTFNLRVYFHMLIMILVILGSLNWGIVGIFRINLLEQLFDEPKIRVILYIIIGLAGLYLLFRRDTYLPFLSEGVLPEALLKEKRPEHFEKEILIHTVPNSTIAYWASDSPSKKVVQKIQRAELAYDKFENSGVVKADAKGNARLFIDTPQRYEVGSLGINKTLPRHLHYRVFKDWYMSPVYTVMLESYSEKKNEPFTSETDIEIEIDKEDKEIEIEEDFEPEEVPQKQIELEDDEEVPNKMIQLEQDDE